MNLFIHQNIVIHSLKIESLSNSSVCQIGSAGIIKPLSNLYNTGGFRKPAPPAAPQPVETPPPAAPLPAAPLVPLVEPRA